MSRLGARVFSREFKGAAVGRIVAGEKVKVVATEMGVWPKLLYDWWARYEQGGAERLHSALAYLAPAEFEASLRPEPLPSLAAIPEPV